MKIELIDDPDSAYRTFDEDFEEWIRRAGEGAYTTVRVMDANSVFMYEMQIDRLYNTLHDMLGGKADDIRLDKTYLRKMVGRFIHNTCVHIPDRLTRSYIHLPVRGGIRVASEALPTGRPFTDGKLIPIIRNTPGIKSTTWIDARSTVRLPPHTEGLIVNGDNIYEGFSSSFFVMKRLPSGGVVVQTAAEGILMGTMRVLVIEVCTRLGYRVDLSFPLVSEIDSWDSAGVSSTSRGFVFFDRIVDPAGTIHPLAGTLGATLAQEVDSEMGKKYEALVL